MVAAMIPIRVRVLDEVGERQSHPSPLWPHEPQRAARFLVQDPFGVRRAIVPVFVERPDGSLEGLATAFHVDAAGTLLTAEHVIHDIWGDRDLGVFRPNTETLGSLDGSNGRVFFILGG